MKILSKKHNNEHPVLEMFLEIFSPPNLPNYSEILLGSQNIKKMPRSNEIEMRIVFGPYNKL